MIERPGTWGEVTAGTTLLSPTESPLLIIRAEPSPKTGKIWYLAANAQGHKSTIKPKPSDLPVTLLECTPEEAELVALRGLEARHIIDLERDRRMVERSRLWLVPPLPQKGRGALQRAQDHISWYHGTYTTDIRTLKQAREAHAEMHTEPVLMDRAHTHKED